MVSTPPGGRRPDVADTMSIESNTSHEGLVLELSPLDGGGEMVDVSSRFRSFSTATVDADGHVHTDCLGSGTSCHDGQGR